MFSCRTCVNWVCVYECLFLVETKQFTRCDDWFDDIGSIGRVARRVATNKGRPLYESYVMDGLDLLGNAMVDTWRVHV